MRIDILTLFPKMCNDLFSQSIIGKAIKNSIIEIVCHDIRDYTTSKHRSVDDYPYGGGAGMVMQADPIANCFEAICKETNTRPYFIYMSPKGTVFKQQKAIELSKMENIAILCGHYEGVDERLIESLIDEEISIGDYVLTGGELPAMVVSDAIARMLDGVLADEVGFQDESHYSGLLEYPQYTRPEVWQGKKVPDVLLSGHHVNIEKWRKEQSLLCTKQRRPDLLEKK